jgi:hypothetical protein
MSPALPARRRAEQFDALLDGRSTQEPSAELAGLLAVAEQIRSLPEVAPRAEFAASLRERLMTEAPAALTAAPGAGGSRDDSRLTVARRRPSSRSRERRIGVAIAAFSLVGATAASAVASQGALPGDTLYPVKRLIEDARTSLAFGDDAKAQVLLSQARTRLDEARDLGTRDDVDVARVEQALHDFSDAADQASAAVLADYADHGGQHRIDDLHSFTAQGITTVAQLADVLPASLDGALSDVTDTLIAIDQSASQACPSCTGGVTELPTQLVQLLSATTSGSTATTSASTPAPVHAGTHRGRTPAPSAGPSSGAAQSTGPLGTVTGPVAEVQSPKPSSGPRSVGGVVGGAGGAVGGTVSGVGGAVSGAGNQVGGPVGGAVSGVGGAVSGAGNTVGGVTGSAGPAVDGVVGGLLGTPSQTPTP